MYKFIAVFALIAVASAAPGFVAESHHALIQPAVLAKTAVVDTSASSAITHQSYTNLEKKVPVVHAYAAAPIIKTVATPVVHTYEAAPVVKAVAPVVHTYAAAPLVHTYASAPVVKTVEATPFLHTYAAAPVVHSLPLVHSAPVVSGPVAYHSYH